MSGAGPERSDLQRAADELAAVAAQGQADVEAPTGGRGEPAGSDVEGPSAGAREAAGAGPGDADPGEVHPGAADPGAVDPDDVAPGPDVERGPGG